MKNRILFILHIPPPVHGSSMVGQQITKSSILNEEFNCTYINLNTSNSVQEIGKFGLYKFIRYLSILWQVSFQLLTIKPKLVYFAITVKGIAFYKDFFVVMLIKLFNKKLVFHLHNKGISTKQHKFVYNILYSLVFRKANIILLSKYLYPDIQKYVAKKLVYYCPNGIQKSQYKSRSHSEKINASSQPNTINKNIEILFLSNLIESKGVFVLLKACEILRKKQVPFHCTFIGGEGDVRAADLEEKVNDMKLKDSVYFAGRKFGAEKVKALTHADIFAFPTYYHNECFPLVLLEAMCFNLPVVSTYEGGIRDIVDEGKTGFLVPQKNAVVLAEKLEQLICDQSLRKKMGAAGHEKFEQEFTINAFEKKI